MNFVPADISSLFKYVAQNPTKFGFAAANVLASNPACGATSSLVCSPGILSLPTPSRPIFGGRCSPDDGGTDHRVGLYLQSADRAEPDFPAGGKCRAGRADARHHHPAADRSFDGASRTERHQRLDQRRSQRADRQERAELPQCLGTAVRRHGRCRLPVAGRGYRRCGADGGRPGTAVLHGRQLLAGRRGDEPLCRLPVRAGMGQRDSELRPAAGPHRASGDTRPASPIRTTPTPTDIPWRWHCAAAAISGSGRSPRVRWRAWCCSRCT